MGEDFYIRFNNDIVPENIPIREFEGYDAAKLTLQQRADGFGRDEMFNASAAKYTKNMDDVLFDRLLQVDDQHGHEADITQGIVIGEKTLELGFDSKKSETNQIDEFTTELLQNGKLELMKRRAKTKVDVFSDRTLDGEPIDPLVPENILYNAYPYVQVSRWKQTQPKTAPAGGSLYVSFFQGIEEYGIEDTLTPFSGTSGLGGLVSAVNQFQYIRAQNNLENVNVSIDCDIDFKYRITGGDSNSAASIKLWWYVHDEPFVIGQPLSDGAIVYTKQITGTTDQDFNISENFTFVIDSIARGQCLSVFWAFDWDSPEHTASPETEWVFNSTEMIITATSLSYNTIVPTLRLFDVMEYLVKSTCGLDIDAPRYGLDGEFWPLRLCNGNLFRLKTDEPFHITLETILNSINQFKGDYQLTPEQEIFFGIFEDFYTPIEIAVLKQRQFIPFKKAYNPRFIVNNVNIGFKSYESQRENSQPNTVDEVHGEWEGLTANKLADNTHPVSIEWVMSARTQERNRRAAIEETSTTATNNDDTIFCIDTTDEPLQNTNALAFPERAYLLHAYIEETDTLSLRNDGSFSWTALGITAGQPFAITNSDENAGNYTVVSVSDGEIILNPQGSISDSGDGDRFTSFTYLVDVTTLVAVSYTNQGLVVSGIENSDRYPNLRYTLGESRRKYHKSYLASMNLRHKDSYIRTTFYKNNPNCVINGNREGGIVTPVYPNGGVEVDTPILSDVLWKNMVFTGEDITIEYWLELVERIQADRGYFRCIDNNEHVVRGYAKVISWDNALNAIVIDEFEEKYSPVIINIVKLDNGHVLINNEYEVTQLNYTPQGVKYRIMDREGELLYTPIMWNRIAVNGNIPQSQNELAEWLLSL